MKIKIWKIGKPAHAEYAPLVDKFLTRLSRAYDCSCEVIRVPDSKKNLEWEQKFLQKLDNRDRAIALDERGKRMSSIEFSQSLRIWTDEQQIQNLHFLEFVELLYLLLLR